MDWICRCQRNKHRRGSDTEETTFRTVDDDDDDVSGAKGTKTTRIMAEVRKDMFKKKLNDEKKMSDFLMGTGKPVLITDPHDDRYQLFSQFVSRGITVDIADLSEANKNTCFPHDSRPGGLMSTGDVAFLTKT